MRRQFVFFPRDCSEFNIPWAQYLAVFGTLLEMSHLRDSSPGCRAATSARSTSAGELPKDFTDALDGPRPRPHRAARACRDRSLVVRCREEPSRALPGHVPARPTTGPRVSRPLPAANRRNLNIHKDFSELESTRVSRDISRSVSFGEPDDRERIRRPSS